MRTIKDVMAVLDGVAALGRAASWDNVGLLAGDPEGAVSKVLLTVDLTRAVLEEAKAEGVELVVAYHPPLFEPVRKVVPGAGIPGMIYEIVREGLAVYALHTALDMADGGVNDLLAEVVGIARPMVLDREDSAGAMGWLRGEKTEGRMPSARGTVAGSMVKLVVFVPEADLGPVSEAIFAAGGGRISMESRYSKCSWRALGTGTFECGADSHPAIGRAGSYEEVSEWRLETVAPAGRIGAVVAALRAAHSYEEPAFDILPMLEVEDEYGLGRVGELGEPVELSVVLERVRRGLGVEQLGLIGPRERVVRKAAVGAGSCGSLFKKALAAGCDFYLTGELRHHDALAIQEAGMTAVVVGHSNSERLALGAVGRALSGSLAGLSVVVSSRDADPIVWGRWG